MYLSLVVRVVLNHVLVLGAELGGRCWLAVVRQTLACLTYRLASFAFGLTPLAVRLKRGLAPSNWQRKLKSAWRGSARRSQSDSGNAPSATRTC